MFWWPEPRRHKGRRTETNGHTEGRRETNDNERNVTDTRDDKTKETHFKETFKCMLLTDGAVNSPQMISRAEICVSSVSRVPFVSACLQFIKRHRANSHISPHPSVRPLLGLCSEEHSSCLYTPGDISHQLHQRRSRSCGWRARVSRHGWCQVKRDGDVSRRSFML